jgi:hypothetical protein
MSESMDAKIRDLETRVAAIEKRLAGGEQTVAIGKRQSAKEFLLSKSTSTETQKVLVLAYFLEKNEGLASLNVQDLEAAFRSAREKLPKNMNDAVNKNVARGLLMEAREKKDAKKAWHLTATGERFVEEQLT